MPTQDLETLHRKPDWAPEEVAFLKQGIAEGKTMREIAAGLALRSWSACWQKAHTLGLRASYGFPAGIERIVSETPQRIVSAAPESDEEPIEDLWDSAVGRTGKEVERHRTQGLGKVRILTDKPIAISLSSDWHISTTGAVYLEDLRAYAEAIRDTEGAYAVTVGDMTENPIKWDKDLPDVKREIRLLDFLVGIFGEKLLWWVSGNHDDWTKAFAGLDALAWISRERRLLFAPDEMTVLVELADPKSKETTASYVFAVRHKFYRNSQLNWTHGVWRWLEERVGQWPVGPDGGAMIPDVLAIAHHHVASVEARDYANKRVWAVRMGSWQAASAHGRAGGWMSCPPTAPTFVLYPHREKPIYGTPDYMQALDALSRERE